MSADTSTTDAQDSEAKRRRIAALDTMELVELWEQPMPANSRAIVQAELERRRYRTKSLPVPPPEDAAQDPLPTAEDVDRRRIDGSARILLVLGVVQLLSAAYSAWTRREDGLAPMLLAAGLPLAIGVGFLVLHQRARARPHPTLTIGLVAYVVLQGIQALLILELGDPALLLGGAPGTIVIVFGLAWGVAASRKRVERSS
jgi:hypothetical protein